MKNLQLAKSLKSLCDARVGIREAATLLFLVPPATISQISSGLEMPKDEVKSKICILKRKKLIHSEYDKDGTVFYNLTPKGKKVVSNAIK